MERNQITCVINIAPDISLPLRYVLKGYLKSSKFSLVAEKIELDR